MLNSVSFIFSYSYRTLLQHPRNTACRSEANPTINAEKRNFLDIVWIVTVRVYVGYIETSKTMIWSKLCRLLDGEVYCLPARAATSSANPSADFFSIPSPQMNLCMLRMAILAPPRLASFFSRSAST